MPQRVTIRNVAKAAGVSACTASYALRGHPKVAPETAQRVREVAERMGYRISTPVSNWMRSLRTDSEAIEKERIYYVITKEIWERNRYARIYFEGGVERAEKHGYKLEPFVYDHREMSERRVGDIIWTRGARGVVVGPLRDGRHEIDLGWQRFASAGFNLFSWKPNVDRASIDYYSTVNMAMRRAYQFGYRRVGLAIYELLDSLNDYNLSAAFERQVQLQEGAEKIPMLLMDSGHFDVDTFSRWFEAYQPDCILAAHCVLPFVEKMGLRVPEDLGYLSLNKLAASRDCAGLEHDFKTIGAVAVDLVVSQLNRNFLGVPDRAMLALHRPKWSDGPSYLSR